MTTQNSKRIVAIDRIPGSENDETLNTRDKDKMLKGDVVRARIRGDVIEPLDTLDLAEGEEIFITIRRTPSEEDVATFRRAAGAWKGTLDAEGPIQAIYAAHLVPSRPTPLLSSSARCSSDNSWKLSIMRRVSGSSCGKWTSGTWGILWGMRATIDSRGVVYARRRHATDE